jgi:LacI family transcriptional regulator, galactose operon repressor
MPAETTLSADDPEGRTERSRPTMREVAALAGVSLKTVSRVVNGESGVSPDLAERVRQAADRLDYRPNLTASNLRRADRKTSTIGLLLEDVSNPYSAAVHRAVEDVAGVRGVSVFAASLDEDPERERALVGALVARRVDGLIMAPASDDHSYLLNERRSGVAVVFVDRPPRFIDADAVVAADREGAATGTRHLLAHGHRRIAFLGDLRSIPTAIERATGFEGAHSEASLEPDPSLIVQGLHTSELAERAAMELLRRPDRPTALFTSQNLVTIGALRALRALDLQRTVAIVGFDDIPLADLLEPGLTVVAQDPTTIGRTAAEVLFGRLDGDRSPTATRVIPTTLIERGSGEIRPV